MNMKKAFITGANKSIGLETARQLLKLGYFVYMGSRDLENGRKALEQLKAEGLHQAEVILLDVSDSQSVAAARTTIGLTTDALDVLINNAGYGLFGTTEETTEAQARLQMETNFFGSLWVAQAVLPVFRKQKSGHLIQVSSFLGLTTLPMLGLYNASKFAVEGLIETIVSEVAHLGIKTTLIEPNGYATDWAGASATQTSSDITDYAPVREAFSNSSESADTWGKPEATVEPILGIVDNPNPPQRLLLGKMAYHGMHQVYTQRLKDIEAWKEVSIAAHGH